MLSLLYYIAMGYFLYSGTLISYNIIMQPSQDLKLENRKQDHTIAFAILSITGLLTVTLFGFHGLGAIVALGIFDFMMTVVMFFAFMVVKIMTRKDNSDGRA